MKKITALILALLMLLPLAGCGSEKAEEKAVVPVVDDNHSLVLMQTDNYEISYGMMSYFYLYGFYNMYSQYQQYFTQMGLDATKPLDEQAYGEDMTWHDYFLEMTLSDARTFLRVAEAARADGFSEDSYRAEAEKQLAKTAKQNDMSEEEYMSKMFGTSLDREDMLNAMTLQLYSYAYYDSVGKNAQTSVTDEECEKYYKENSVKFDKVDYMFYTVTANTANTEDTDAAYNQAKQTAELLVSEAENNGVEGFKTWVESYMKKVNSESSTPMAEDALAGQIERTLEGTVGAVYSENNETSVWMFEAGRKTGDCKLVDNGAGSYTVYMVTKAPYRNDAQTKNVRHILFKPESYENAEAAKAKAEEVLALWEKGEATEESFDILAKEYNDDSNSLYENVGEGEMVQSFNDWIFEKSRKPGDAGIVETDYGYHIMYFVREGNPKWKNDVINTLANVTLTGLLKEYEEKYTITENEENMEKLPKSIPSEALAAPSSQTQEGVNVY